MKRRAVLAGALTVGCCAMIGAPWVLSRSRTKVQSLRGLTMGTSYQVTFYSGATAASSLRSGVQAIVNGVDAEMSTYRPDSELSRFNTSKSLNWTEFSEPTRNVFDEALRVGDLTNGAFDVTVGPLVNLWGFGAAGTKLEIPKDETLADIADSVDYRLLTSNGTAVRKSKPDLQADLSGIAKGYAVDKVAELLDSRGIESYLVDIGGELRSRGRKPDGSSWRLGIERPVPGSRSVYHVVEIGDQAIATSGDYRNYFMHEGKRYSHTLDPRTGRPVTHFLASVSVIAATAMTADALSTAIMVLGPDKGYEFARSRDLAASLAIHRDDGFDERRTGAFEAYSVG